MQEEKTKSKFKREHFIRVDLDAYHYYYSFGVPGFEICLEPCAAGFDVAVYTDDSSDGILRSKNVAAEPKRCTKTGDYTTSAEALFGDRKDEDWNKALAIADELLEKYMKDSEDVKAKLSQEKEKGNELITGEEIKALRARTKRITMQQALRATMEGGFFVVIPMDLKSGYCVSYTIIENPPNQIEVFSVGAHGNPVDPADAAHLAKAVLHEYVTLGNLLSKGMTHFMKKVEIC